MKTICLLLFSCFLWSIPTANAQESIFIKAASWEDVVQRARTENKNIFVDLYATWCGPCKQMVRETLSNDTISALLNDQFISIQVQTDSTYRDDVFIKSWYGTAHAFTTAFHVTAYPTYLFFSKEGKILHKEVGFKNVQEFRQSISASLDTNKQYYSLLEENRYEHIDDSSLTALINYSVNVSEKDKGNELISYYINKRIAAAPYFYLQKQYLAAISNYRTAVLPGSPIFIAFLEKNKQIDSVMGASFSKSVITDIIFNNEIKPALSDWMASPSSTPDWKALADHLAVKYDPQYTQQSILSAKVNWYEHIKDWPNHAKYLVQLVNLNGAQDVPNSWQGLMYLNNNAWRIFQYSTEGSELLSAIDWTDRALAMGLEIGLSVNVLDTKANLLYKLKRREKAIETEKKAKYYAIISHQHALLPGINETLNKMKTGKKTW